MSSGAGKGDSYRPVDQEKYSINFDAIYHPPVCLVCGEKMRQWKVGQNIFYCRNKNCLEFMKVKSRNEV